MHRTGYNSRPGFITTNEDDDSDVETGVLYNHTSKPHTRQYVDNSYTPIIKKQKPHAHRLKMTLPRIIAPIDIVQYMTIPSKPKEVLPNTSFIPPSILDNTKAINLLIHLPTLCTISSWKLIYSLEDGASLAYLLKNVQEASNVLLLVKTTTGKTLGAYLYNGMQISKTYAYTGSPRSFIFTYDDQDEPQIYRYTTKNQFYLKIQQSIAIGGDNTAIWINEFLSEGVTLPSKTYDSPLLCESRFKIQMLEVWSFASPK